jgi:hypothetical protein
MFGVHPSLFFALNNFGLVNILEMIATLNRMQADAQFRAVTPFRGSEAKNMISETGCLTPFEASAPACFGFKTNASLGLFLINCFKTFDASFKVVFLSHSY